ncbi:MAG: zinc ribbon domain-containing protein [Pseudomonadota bacterium]
MSIIKCRECGNEVSTEAKTCPKCGAKVKKPAGVLTIILVAVIGAVLLAPFVLDTSRHPPPEKTAAEQAAEKAEKTREAGSLLVMNSVMSRARDPDSLKFETVLVNEDASVVCVKYRARNGFGGMNRELLVTTTKNTWQDAGGWNRNCLGEMFEMLRTAK